MKSHNRTSSVFDHDLTHLGDGLTILVEEEQAIRNTWEEFFHKCGMRLLTFESAESFISNYLHDDGPVEFFFDQDFGSRRGVGVQLASYVQTWKGRTGTSLVTSYYPEEFEEEIAEGILSAVFPKFPQGIFGDDYFTKFVRDQVSAKGLTAFVKDHVDRLSDALIRFDEVTRPLARG